MRKGFDNDKYLAMQSEHIRERIQQFDNKLYLEFGGKLYDDYHASRVLPGFEPDSKLRMLMQLADQVEIVIVISAEDIEKNKVRGDLGITYDSDLLPCRFNASGAVSVYMPESTYVKKYKNNAKLGVITSQHEKVTEEIQQIIETGGYKEGTVVDNAEAFQTMNTVIFIMQVFIYGFIVLITLITIANIINTISTGISLRRKEFAMLKSVGITPKGFRKMICLESFFYGERALIVAIPVSLFLCYNMNVNLNAAAVPFFVPWKTYLIVIAVVFILVGLSMYYAMYKLRNDSIIETLKEEVL